MIKQKLKLLYFLSIFFLVIAILLAIASMYFMVAGAPTKVITIVWFAVASFGLLSNFLKNIYVQEKSYYIVAQAGNEVRQLDKWNRTLGQSEFRQHPVLSAKSSNLVTGENNEDNG